MDTGKMNTEKMDTERGNALHQVRDSIEIIESARADQSLKPAERNQLEIASVKLRSLERSLIKNIQLELVASLTADSRALRDLTVQIKQSSEKLLAVAATIEKAATMVESVIKIITTAVALGLL